MAHQTTGRRVSVLTTFISLGWRCIIKMLKSVDQLQIGNWLRQIPRNCLVDRDKLIVEQCRGSSVLHIGACDAPFELDKGLAGTLLHQKVRAVARHTVGVDIDEEAIAALRKLGIDDIFNINIIEDEAALVGQTFDFVLCCDVIEHVTSPGPLLRACRRFMHAESTLVLTTINATALKPALRALMGKEAVHPDHVAYFSFSTLTRLVEVEGFRPSSFGVFGYPTISPFVGWVTRSMMRLAPGSADGIILNARLS